MKYEVREDTGRGRILFLTDEKLELGIALDYGIRILHLSCAGEENLFYEQPEECCDGLTTPQGWKIYGGHRLWAAPETDRTYYPDNTPISYMLGNNGVTLIQEDPWLMLRKEIDIRFESQGAVSVLHRIVNTGSEAVELASWGISSFDGGGSAEVCFDGGTEDCFYPERVLNLWGTTRLYDPRLRFADGKVFATHRPIDDHLKLGLSSLTGLAKFQNKGQQLELRFPYESGVIYPDGGCNFELYMDRYIMELEVLGPKQLLLPGQAATHREEWTLSQLI